jgi:hypothetical protein
MNHNNKTAVVVSGQTEAKVVEERLLSRVEILLFATPTGQQQQTIPRELQNQEKRDSNCPITALSRQP